MDGSITITGGANVGNDLGSAGENEQSIGKTRKISVSATSNMVEDATISKLDVIDTTDDVILKHTFIIDDKDVGQIIIPTHPKSECESESEACSSPPRISITATSFTPTATHIPRPVSEDEWQIDAQQPVLHVHCKKITGELHKNRFGSGAKGKCIRVGKLWLTPSEFEAHCGRSASKDWKRSIRFQGVTLNDLIEEGYVQVHASCCACSVCLEDNLAAGPVRLYQHYKRRKKNVGDDVKSPYSRCTLELFQSAPATTATITVTNIDQLANAVSNIENNSTRSVNQASNQSPVLEGIANLADLPLDKAWALMSETLLNLLKSTSRAREMLEELRQRTNRELDEQRRVLLEEKEVAVREAKLEARMAALERHVDGPDLIASNGPTSEVPQHFLNHLGSEEDSNRNDSNIHQTSDILETNLL